MLVADNITKKFSGVTALDRVCLELHEGKVNAILGENGAGKSTLMKILSGVDNDYEGQIVWHAKPTRFQNTKEAQQAGIAIIHQELNLIPYLSITENIFLGQEILTKWGTLHKRRMRDQATVLLQKLRLDIDPATPVQELKVGQQQLVEIAKALLLEPKVIIMDEPTSAITDQEVETLFGIIEELRADNKTIVYISHKLDELFRIADRYIVLRDGKSIESGNIQGMTHDQLIQKMVGREIFIPPPKIILNNQENVLEINGLSLKKPNHKESFILSDISFHLKKGEVLGIFGLMGAGRTELLETIFGLHPTRATGQMYLNGEALHLKSSVEAVRAGLALVPEDRKRDGIVPGMTVSQNISLASLGEQVEKNGFLSNQAESQLAEKYIQELGVKTSSSQQLIKNLSGGNQQKVILGKWLATHPKVLLLDEPTRGIDIHAKSEIYKLILKLAASGLGIIMVSSELPEIFAVSDRVLVLAEGKLTLEMLTQNATEDILLKAAIPKVLQN
ncbi:sugar ABC transporter ATP-binding protein [Runella zeae]|uniref:sugar ABC transporter ATP-binding protein n=1 Tax=Runella zeae TaxID=94255 RepID=UPI00040CEAA3|nr:sugar ABC transporter ATP-binding protein [Runella zeae]